MSNEKKSPTTEDIGINSLLAIVGHDDSELKKYLIEYTGTKLDNENVTVHMIADIMAADFPEFTFAFAEKNYLCGYQQGLSDAELFERTPPKDAE